MSLFVDGGVRMQREWSRRLVVVLVLGGVVSWLACGGGGPQRPTTASTPLPLPDPTPTPTPVPTPTPTPTPCATCEAPVTNVNPTERLTLRLYSVETPFGDPVFDYDPKRGIPVEWVGRLDVVGRDREGYETNGQGEIRFFFSDEKLVKVSGGHTHQRRLTVTAPGELTCWVTQDGVRSNDLVLQLVP
jgi:hypothetical protein